MPDRPNSSAAVALYRSILGRNPDAAPVRADLADALLADGDFDAAIAQASAALAADPSLARAWLIRAATLKALCRFDEAAADFERAATLAPDRAGILVNLANTYAEIDRLWDAERLLRRAVALAPGSKEAQASLGSVLMKLGRMAEAEAPCRAALALDPGLTAAHQNLSGILAETDPAAARLHRDAAYGRRQVFIEPAPRPERTVLVLAAADPANVPLRHLIPRATTTVIHWYIDYATADPDPALARADVVFNAIGDPDLAPVITPPVARFLHARAGDVLNPPERVAMTRRSDLPRLLAGIPGIIVPAVVRLDGPVETPSGPVLIRPIGSHGGEGLRRCDDAGAAEAPCYVTQFIDFASADGWYRKYRMIFVDGRAYPYHLAIARDWLVHYWTAGMEQDSARREEERRFLAAPAEAIGSGAMASGRGDRAAPRAGLRRGRFRVACRRQGARVRGQRDDARASGAGSVFRLPQPGGRCDPVGFRGDAETVLRCRIARLAAARFTIGYAARRKLSGTIKFSWQR